MSWYAVYRDADGALASEGSTVADPLPSGFSAKEFADRPQDGFRWSADTLEYVAAPPIPPRLMRAEYIQRFTADEWTAIVDDTRPNVRRLVHLTNVADHIDLGSPVVQGGAQYLESLGLIAAGRAAQILAY